MAKIFKYFSDDVRDHVFVREGHVGFKCTLPEEYNDPFELFLGVDLEQDADALATYKDIVDEIPSLLTTCFSKSPVIAPLWAHYGNNHKGFVVGFDTDQIQEDFPNVLVRDVTYRDIPSEDITNRLLLAAQRMKFRDAELLRRTVYFHGYFSKYSAWSYEEEIRGVNFEEYVEDVSGRQILYVPKDGVSSIIVGANSSSDVREALREIALELEADFYVEKIGRSYPRPFLLEDGNSPNIFIDGGIKPADRICGECSEPMRTSGELCPWCAIDEADRINAAARNPFRALDHFGLLEDYLKDFQERPTKPYG